MKRALVLLVRLATRLYYRLRRLGRTVPADGPVLLVANHPNGLLDPALVLSATDREVLYLGKEPLFRLFLVGFFVRNLGVVPVYRAQDGADTKRNESAFDAVFAALERGGVVALFPEGKAHDEPALQDLRTGAARMALGADPTRAGEPRIVPVGLVYARKTRFQSRATIWIGDAVDAADLRPLHATDERAAVRALTERIAGALGTVTVNVDAAEDLPLVEFAERVWRPAHGAERVRRLAALARGARRLRASAPAEYEALRERIVGFRRVLRRLGLRPGSIDVEYAAGAVVRYAVVQVLALALLGPLALVGLAWWALPYQVVRAVVLIWRPEPVISSTVQVFGGFVLLLPWHLALCAALGVWAGWPVALAAGLALPACGLVAFGWLERVGATWAEARRFVRFAGARRLRDRLRRERDALAAELDRLERALEAEGAG